MYGLLNGMIASTFSEAKGHFCCFKPLQYPMTQEI